MKERQRERGKTRQNKREREREREREGGRQKVLDRKEKEVARKNIYVNA